MRIFHTFLVSGLLASSVAGADFENAKKLFNNRKYQTALTEFQQLDNSPNNLKKDMYIGYCLMKLKKYPEAINQFNLAFTKTKNPRHKSEALLAIAKIQETLGKQNEAMATYAKLMTMKRAHPKHVAFAIARLKKNYQLEQTVKRPCPGSGLGIYKSGRLAGIYNASTAVIFNTVTGKLYGIWGTDGIRLATPGAQPVSLWKISFRNPDKTESELNSSHIKLIKVTTRNNAERAAVILDITAEKGNYKADLQLEASLRKNSPEIRWKMNKIANRSQQGLWQVVFPQISVKPDGKPEENNLILPWRRGRLISGIGNAAFKQQYPGSSARFQCFALYNQSSLKGFYFSTDDTTGHEKEFRQTWNPVNNALTCSVTQFPANRGIPGNNYQMTYHVVSRPFTGDWYDAAQIYRAWWIKQPWAVKGNLTIRKDIPEWLKKTPVFLRFYARYSKKMTVEKNVKSAHAWNEFLHNQAAAGTWYHYAKFLEPCKHRVRYPVAEIQGYCAPAYPGLLEGLKKMTSWNIRPNVYLQSEIYNQYQSKEDAKYMFPALRVDPELKPILYEKESWIACRSTKRWQKRFLDMCKHVMDMGFWGIYLDTFGKNHITHECFNPKHGHPAGGGNFDTQAQLSLGRQVRKLIKGMNPDSYMGGEACTEIFVPVLDYKLNAMNTYPGQLPLERAMFGDYILSHGRTIRADNELNSCRMLASNFTEGMIPGRFFGQPFQSKPAQDFLRQMITYTNNSFEYLRGGKMLRPLELSPAPQTVTVIESVKRRKMQLPSILSAAYRSGKNNSVGIVLVNIGEKTGNISFKLTPAEYGFNKIKIQQMNENGQYREIASTSSPYVIKSNLKPLSIAFYKLQGEVR